MIEKIRKINGFGADITENDELCLKLNEIIDVITQCMGIKNKKLTKEDLEDFINSLPTYLKLNSIFTN